jgi:subtilisin-like proprotein convertase family protein
MLRSVVSNARWRAVALVAALAAAVWLVVLLGMPEEADAGSRYRIVTKTFSNPAAITQKDETSQPTPYPSQVAAGGMRRGKILDVNVTLRGFSHTYPDDVDVLLVGPRGQNLIIMSDAGAAFDVSNLELRLNDEAVGWLPDETQLFGGTYRPSNWTHTYGSGNIEVDSFPGAPAPSGAFTLSTFDGTNPNGTWSLYVRDDVGFDAGQFAGGWSLRIKAKVLRRS